MYQWPGSMCKYPKLYRNRILHIFGWEKHMFTFQHRDLENVGLLSKNFTFEQSVSTYWVMIYGDGVILKLLSQYCRSWYHRALIYNDSTGPVQQICLKKYRKANINRMYINIQLFFQWCTNIESNISYDAIVCFISEYKWIYDSRKH